MTRKQALSYQAYLLRLRQRRAGIWQVTLHNVHTNEELQFADLESLFAFLRQELLCIALPMQVQPTFDQTQFNNQENKDEHKS